MKRIILYLFLILSLNVSGQIMPGVMASSYQTVVASECNQNLLIYSEQLDNATGWERSNITVTANQANDLAGEATLELCSIGWSNGLLRQTLSVSANTTYIFSFEAKLGTATAVHYSVYNATNWNYIVASTDYFSSLNASTPTRVSVSFTTPAGCTSVKVAVLDATPITTGTLYIGRCLLTNTGSCYVKTEATNLP